MFTSLFINVLLATTAFAAPRVKLGSTLAQRVAAREARRGNPLKLSTSPVPASTNISHAEVSTNWVGAVIESPPAGQKFTSVTGRFNAPTPSRPSGSGSGSFSASAWVGIDGDTFQNAILQSGIDFTVSSSGAVSYDAWFEWFPNFAMDFSGIPISPGNTISVTVTATSSTRGTVVLENVSTGKTVQTTVSAPSSSAALGGQNAEWIVEDFEEGNSQVNFANFNPVTFTSASASTGSSTVGVSGATIINLESESGQILATASITSSSSIQVVHS